MMRPITRRRFLRGAGGLSLALPIMHSLSRRSLADPAAVDAPKRFIAIFTANGQCAPHWYPTLPGPGTTIAPNIVATPLSQIAGNLSTVLGPEFNTVRSKINLLRGLDIVPIHTRDHWPGKMLAAYGDQLNPHVTIDQIMARSVNVYQSEPRLRSLNLKAPGYAGCGTFLSHATISCDQTGGVVSPVLPIEDPAAAFDIMFSRSSRSVRIVDQLNAQYTALRKNRRLSNEDRQRLDAHLAFLADLERRVKTPPVAACDMASDKPQSTVVIEDFPTKIPNHVDLIVSAIKCGITRVAALTMTEAAESRTYNFLPGVSGEGFHSKSHEVTDDAYRQLAIINHWHAAQVADLLTKLDVVEDPVTGKTYLDNSIVYWGSELGVKPGFANADDGHMNNDMPVLLAGGAGGFFKTGQFIDYRKMGQRQIYSQTCGAGSDACYREDRFPYVGHPLNDLLITLMMAMGLSPGEWEQGGERGFGDYSENFNGQYTPLDGRTGLTGIV